MKIKKPCLSLYHPFKQTWYWYDDQSHTSIDSPNYCTSCMSFQNFMVPLLTTMLGHGYDTLYGNSKIFLSRDDAHSLVDQAFDKIEQLDPNSL